MKRQIFIVFTLVMIVCVGCSVTESIPGLGGDHSGQQLKDTAHPDTPDGVRCYVCHKEEIPDAPFHQAYSRECEECHGQNTWVAYKYPHEKWPLGIHRQMQCVRCHTEIAVFDFSVWQCWGCHHDQAEITASHRELGYDDIENCIMCHQGTPEES